ncbi:MAG: NUDIX domain-containing protein [Stellaceae bacterium]
MSGPADLFLDDQLPLRPGDAVAAILLLPDGRYLLQHRDRRPGIFFPDHWGCFGGAVDNCDASDPAALRRELHEELGLALENDAVVYFSGFTFDMPFCGVGSIYRTFFEICLVESQVAGLRLAEGSEFGAFTTREALGGLRLTPYDAFALWLHANQARLRRLD